MLIPLHNSPRDYAWGSATLLAELEGRAATGEPEAEVWFGDHPADPADLAGGGTLRDVTGGTLPYLLKLLAASRPLSIQVHPSRARAEEGFAREEAGRIPRDAPWRNYRDANHKAELIVALGDGFEALVGLRRVDETRRLLDALGESPGVARLRGALDAARDPLRAGIVWALTAATTGDIDDIAEAVGKADAPEFADALTAVARLADHHPGDGGVAVALLMNHLSLASDEAVFLPAGTLHAYLRGLGVEIMAASDNVLRGGLTAKHVDVPELLRVLDSRASEPSVLRADAGASEFAYPVPVPDFALRRIEIGADAVDCALTGPSILLATRGALVVSAGERRLAVGPGRAVFASEEERRIRVDGPGRLFIAQPGVVGDTPQEHPKP